MPHSLRAKLSGLRYKGILEDKDYKRLCHALDLEKAEQEPCDDAISREDRLIDLANAIESDDSGYWTNKRISSALRNISSVTQKSGKWKWILNKEKSHFFDVYECSNCGKLSRLTNYCPNCGARMESEDKE